MVFSSLKSRKFFFIFFLIIFFNFKIANSVEQKRYDDTTILKKKLDELNWKNFDDPKQHYLQIEEAKASIDILKNEYYLDNWEDINQFSWWTWGYGIESDLVAMIVGDDYSIYVYWKDEGYIKLDDWKDVNPKAFMDDMISTQNSFKEDSIKNNTSYVTNIEWIFEPTLNDEKKVVSYSYKVTWDDGNVNMESKNLKLGKKGYLLSQYVSQVDENTNFKETAEYAKNFAEYISFDENFRHADYKKGDKVAAVGIGGLVAGTLGVKTLAKAGAFAKFIPLLAKFWWILLAPIAALGFFRKKKNSQEKSD